MVEKPEGKRPVGRSSGAKIILERTLRKSGRKEWTIYICLKIATMADPCE
jgi:hypothetical protein